MVSKIPFAISILFAILFLTPIANLIITSTSLGDIARVLTSPTVDNAIVSTFYPAAVGAAIAVTLAFTYAWIIFRTDIPYKRILGFLPYLGLAIPAEVRAISFVFLLSPRVGVINVAFDNLFHVSWPLFNIYSNAGLALAGATGGVPFAYTVMSAAMMNMSSSYEDSGRLAGGSIFSILRRITVPLLLPAILSAFILDFIYNSATFDYAFIFGSVAGSGVNTIATEIALKATTIIPPDYAASGALSIIYLIAAICAVSVYLWITKTKSRYTTVSGAEIRTLFGLRRWQKVLGVIMLFAIMTATFFALAAMVIYVSFLPYYSPTLNILSSFTWQNWNTILFGGIYSGLFWTAVKNSLILATTTATLTTILAAILSWTALRSKVRWAKLLEYFNVIPFAFPGIVYGLALLWFSLSVPVFSNVFYGTIWILMFTLLLQWTPFSIRIMAGSVVQISDSMEEAATVSGASWLRMFRTVYLPLIRTTLAISFVYIFLDSFRELGSVYLLTSSQTFTLTSLVIQLYSQATLVLPVVAATSTFMILMMSVFLLIANRVIGEQLFRTGPPEVKMKKPR